MKLPAGFLDRHRSRVNGGSREKRLVRTTDTIIIETKGKYTRTFSRLIRTSADRCPNHDSHPFQAKTPTRRTNSPTAASSAALLAVSCSCTEECPEPKTDAQRAGCWATRFHL